jgi:phosphotriesterase-related protein
MTAVSSAAQHRPVIRTILKDLDPSQVANGTILFHEHLSIGPAFFDKMRAGASSPGTVSPRPPSFLENADLVTDELKASKRDGVTLVVDGGHPDMYTDYAVLRRVAEASGVHIVASGGYYLHLTYPPEVAQRSEEELVERLTHDAEQYRLGAYGEIGVSAEITDDERKVLRVIAKSHQRNGLPIFTHNPHSGCKKCALEQLDILERTGVTMHNLCIGHLSDITDDPEALTHKEIAKRGAFLGFDTVGHRLGQGDSQKVKLILKVLDAGLEDHVLLSSDFASDPETKANGGAGYSSVSSVFIPKLRYAGVGQATIRKMLNDNPRRFLSFVPK